MFPVRTLALIVAVTLSTSAPLATVANAAPAPEEQPQAVRVDPSCEYVPRLGVWASDNVAVPTWAEESDPEGEGWYYGTCHWGPHGPTVQDNDPRFAPQAN